ncbi:hypothetical protein [Chitinophaga sancti]|uniref:hypothetical protein n=1 Tax=Chitinophaga sancti TaxID=1004 RepID=UPI003F7A3F8F
MKKNVGNNIMEENVSPFNIIRRIWKRDGFIISVASILLAVLVISNRYGYRVCNCASTEKYVPGQDRQNGHSGVHTFYHK